MSLRGWFDAKQSLLEERYDSIQPVSAGDKVVQTFPNSISPKINVIVRQEFELAYYDIKIHYVMWLIPIKYLKIFY